MGLFVLFYVVSFRDTIAFNTSRNISTTLTICHYLQSGAGHQGVYRRGTLDPLPAAHAGQHGYEGHQPRCVILGCDRHVILSLADSKGGMGYISGDVYGNATFLPYVL